MNNILSFIASSSEELKVFPVYKNKKIPLIKDWVNKASNCRIQIEEWFKDKDFNAGILTGSANMLWVLDIDKKSGGLDSLQKLDKKFGNLQEKCSFLVRTGGGGLHLYFALTGDDKIYSKIGVLPGIDIKGEGGYVVSPYSVHENGNKYLPLNEEKELSLSSLKEAPDHLIEHLLSQKPKSHTSPVSPYSHIAGTKAKMGERNNLLFKRLCSLRNAPYSQEGFLAMAKEENRLLCEPPLSESEVIALATGVFKRYKYENEEYSIPKLDQKAYYGILGKIITLIKNETEASPEAMLFQGLVILGNLMNRKFYRAVSGSRIYSNVFTVIVGKTSKARKGTSFKDISYIFKRVWEKGFENRIKRGVSSGEGIIWIIRDPEIEEITNKKGKIEKKVLDKGTTEKEIILFEEEFSKLIKVSKRESNTVSEVLRVAFDSNDLQSISKEQPAKATAPLVSLIGHITKEEFIHVHNDVDKSNGLFNRILWCHSERSNVIPLPKNFEDIDFSQIEITLNNLKKFINESEETCVEFSDDGKEIWEIFYKQYAYSPDENNASIKGRTETYILKIATILAVSDTSTIIRAEHIEAAIAIVDYSNKVIDHVFGISSTNGSNELKIINFLKNNGGIAQRSLIQKKIYNNKLKAETLNQVRDQLEMTGSILIETSNNSEIWKLTSDTSK